MLRIYDLLNGVAGKATQIRRQSKSIAAVTNSSLTIESNTQVLRTARARSRSAVPEMARSVSVPGRRAPEHADLESCMQTDYVTELPCHGDLLARTAWCGVKPSKHSFEPRISKSREHVSIRGIRGKLPMEQQVAVSNQAVR
ncbi:hypothetical protein L915_12327 [Phytophthora nicotianae]|uniref:Uncharacterized protein n=1 Tax=Phytophthora nicotianae TaxID=4792 RepID=W2GIY9_PHYNI|nr:hypothetical protein L915_12327 [Phytophthora nicotianae]